MRLRTSHPSGPGYRRIKQGRGFRFVDADGRRITDEQERHRVRELVIPPAWREVWICPWPSGHLQAVGTDEAGRRQYLYHPQFRAQQERAKHERVLEAAVALPKVKRRVVRDLAGRGLTRQRVLALGVRLLDLGFFRVGDQQYTHTNDSYGLTTVRRDQVTCRGGEIGFDCPAKSGRQYCRELVDDESFTVVRALLRRQGGTDRLLEYWEGRRWHQVEGSDLNEHLQSLSGHPITTKDFRTWHATVLAAVALAVSAGAAKTSKAARRRAASRAVREVANYLGNTPAVCRASYINPRVFELFEEGVTVEAALPDLGARRGKGPLATQGPVEEAVLSLLS
ncbi:DNA topoisomerase IB [Streptomyces parvus]|uniref:DNA topoisomerase n=1 Tax=Streptomyces parvus TaxID=66428 RepID=A0A5D4JDB6_9ACTN|nr:DNA topoisomerase IB [Streptomyces parvus]TYR63192.1 DNA topoisomerase IB [Streptomyces parvus]